MTFVAKQTSPNTRTAGERRPTMGTINGEATRVAYIAATAATQVIEARVLEDAAPWDERDVQTSNVRTEVVDLVAIAREARELADVVGEEGMATSVADALERLVCSGVHYPVNPDAPEEGEDVRHEAPCPVHSPATPYLVRWHPRQPSSGYIDKGVTYEDRFATADEAKSFASRADHSSFKTGRSCESCGVDVFNPFGVSPLLEDEDGSPHACSVATAPDEYLERVLSWHTTDDDVRAVLEAERARRAGK